MGNMGKHALNSSLFIDEIQYCRFIDPELTSWQLVPGEASMSDTFEHPTKTQIYEHFLACLDREEALIHNRMSWGLQWNIAAFASLFALNQIPGADESWIWVASLLVSVSGMIAGILSFLGVGAAQSQIEYLIEQIEERFQVTKASQWTGHAFIRPYGEKRRDHKRGAMVAFTFPMVFIVIWAGVSIYYISQFSKVF